MPSQEVKYPFWPYPLDPKKPRNKHEAKFWEVHALNPAIYDKINAQAQTLLSQGRTHYGVEAFFASIRWDSVLGMNNEEFKMNDHYTAYYARFWLQNNPYFWGFFELRRVKGEYPKKDEAEEEPVLL